VLNKDKSKEQLIAELKSSRQRVAESEKSDKGESTDPTKLRRRAEERLKSERTATDRLKVNDTERLRHELQVHQIELEMQNQELRNALVQAEESRARYSDLYDFAPVGYLTLDENGLVLEANLTIARQLGVERSRLVGCPFSVYVVLADRNAFYSHLSNVLKDKTHQACGVRLTKGAGGDFHALLDTIFVEDAGGNGRFRTSATDITERKQAETALAESEQRFRSLFENAPVAYQCLDTEGRFIDVNQKLCDLLGYRPEELLGRNFGEFWPENIREKFPGLFETFKRNLHVSSELPLIAKDGRKISVIVEGLIQQDNEGNFLRTHCILTDITTRKQIEEALGDSELRLRTILQTANEGFWLIDNDAVIIDLNPRMCDILGRDKEDVLGKKIFDFADDENKDIFQQQIELRDQGKTGAYEIELFRSDGLRVFCQFNATPLFDGAGNKVGSFAMVTDITDHKRAERKTAQLASIVESSDDAIIGKNLDGMITSWNKGAEKIYGYAESEVIGKRISILLPPGHEDEVPQILGKIKAGEHIEHYETARRRKDGQDICMSLRISPVRNDEGRIVAASTIGRDITERKRAEEALGESEKRYKQLLESVTDYIFTVQVQDNRTLATVHGRGCAAVTGYTPEDYEADPYLWYRMVHEQDRQAVRDQAARILSGEEVLPLEHRIIHRDGSTCWVRNTTVKHYSEQGELIAYDGLIADITQRKLAEQSLQENKSKLELALQSAHMGVWHLDLIENKRCFDKQVCHLLGIDPAKFTGTAEEFYKAVHPDDREMLKAALARTIEHDAPYETEYRALWPDGSIHYIIVRGKLLRDKTGHPVRVNGLIWDVSERKLAQEEKEMLEAKLRQAQKLEAIGTLAGGIAHDFNNILSPIIGYAQMALDDFPHSNPMRFGQEQIMASGLRAKDLVRQILAFGRPGEGQQKEPAAVSSIVKEAIKLLRASLPSSIKIVYRIENCTAKVDPTQIHQVLMNLCTNAAHAMGNKGILEVRLTRINLSENDLAYQSIVGLKPGPHLRLSVSDTGSGMDKPILERIFDPFFTTKAVGKGTGLGLAVVHGIVKHHDGAITVQSEVGKGSTFSIYIPAVEYGAEMAGQTRPVPPTGTERILLVDDEQSLVQMGTTVLKRLGYKVTPDTNSLHTLEIFRSRPGEFDLIITDHTMPNLTGTDLIREIRRIRPDMPIILCTGFSEEVTRETAADLGVELIMKPFEITQFAELIRKVLDERTS